MGIYEGALKGFLYHDRSFIQEFLTIEFMDQIEASFGLNFHFLFGVGVENFLMWSSAGGIFMKVRKEGKIKVDKMRSCKTI